MTKHKIEVDLNMIEYGLTRLIEICDKESEYLKKVSTIKLEEIESLSAQKEDLMGFISMNIHLIGRYMKLHKDKLDNLDEIKSLASLSLDQTANIFMNLDSTRITISGVDHQEELEIIFLNDEEGMVQRIASKLYLMMMAIKHNLVVINSRKDVFDMTMQYAKKFLDKGTKLSYSPRRGEKKEFSPLIHDHNC